MQISLNHVDLENMLKNEDLFAKIGVDTAESKLSRVCRSKQAIPTPGHKSGSVNSAGFGGRSIITCVTSSSRRGFSWSKMYLFFASGISKE